MNQKIIEFPKISDPRGNLTFIETNNQIPFEIKRIFWTYDIPGGETRGGHAYKIQQEVIVALSGSFEIVVKNKNGRLEKYFLNRSNVGLYLPPNTWRQIENFSTNAIALHLSNSVYNKSDYIFDFDLFLNNE